MSKHLTFVLYGTSDSGKTNRWEIRNLSDDSLLAIVAWYAPWRRYVVTPQPCTLFDAECLEEITDFLREQMAARRSGS